MPLYEYECSVCGHRFELIQRFADPPADRCASCGKGPVHKLLSAPAIHFKGTGWYVTDYANKKSDGSPRPDASAPDAGVPASGAPGGTAAEAKPAAEGAAKPAATESATAPAKSDGGGTA